jgi:hypothetical protein
LLSPHEWGKDNISAETDESEKLTIKKIISYVFYCEIFKKVAELRNKIIHEKYVQRFIQPSAKFCTDLMSAIVQNFSLIKYSKFLELM